MDKHPWHLAIRRYRGTGSPEEIGVRVRAGLLPLLRRQPGFQAYYAARIDGGGGVFAVTAYSDPEAAVTANLQALDWARTELVDLLTGAPEVTQATATPHRAATPDQGEGYLMIRRAAILADAAALEDALQALVQRQPGFRMLLDGREAGDGGHALAVGVFSNRDTATAAHAQTVALMARHREVWPAPAEILLAGEILVRAMA